MPPRAAVVDDDHTEVGVRTKKSGKNRQRAKSGFPAWALAAAGLVVMLVGALGFLLLRGSKPNNGPVAANNPVTPTDDRTSKDKGGGTTQGETAKGIPERDGQLPPKPAQGATPSAEEAATARELALAVLKFNGSMVGIEGK